MANRPLVMKGSPVQIRASALDAFPGVTTRLTGPAFVAGHLH
jgi:hypothetical protein